MENNQKIGIMSSMALTLLMSMGADIIAPKPVKEPMLKALGLKNNHFVGIDECLKQVNDRDEKLSIIKGAIISHLTPSQIMTLHEFCHDAVIAVVGFCQKNPEYRQNLGTEEILRRIMSNERGSDYDIDIKE